MKAAKKKAQAKAKPASKSKAKGPATTARAKRRSGARAKSGGGKRKAPSKPAGGRRPARRYEAYDKAKWHYEGNFPEDLPPENGGTHIGVYLAWAVNHDMAGEELLDDAGADLEAVRDGRMTGRELLFRHLDGALTYDDLNAEGNAFTEHYYKSYTGDYSRVVGEGLSTVYHAEDGWELYELVARVIEEKYRRWKDKRARALRR